MKNRRDFLRTAGLVTAGGILLPQFACRMRQGKPAVTTPEHGITKKVGLQIYTLRDQISQSLEGTMEKVAEAGYSWIEAYGYENGKILGKTPVEFRELVEGLGMTMPAIHSVTELSSEEGKTSILDSLKKTAEDARTAGAEYLVYAYLEENERQSLDDYRRHADLFNQFGEICNNTGLRFAYHNHDFEFLTMDGMIPYDLLLEKTEPELVTFELDMYWIKKGGYDPLDYFNKAPGRFELYHIKDMEPGDEKFFAEVGQGIIDFEPIFNARETAGMKYFFVEQDQSRRDPLESIRMSIEYLNQAEFV